MKTSHRIFIGLLFVGLATAVACAGEERSELNEGGKDAAPVTSGGGQGQGASGHGGDATGGSFLVGGFPPEECDVAKHGIGCDVPKCNTADGTTITGKAFAPNGELPLYNVALYIPKFPDEPLDPITPGAACEQCPTTIENYVATARSDATGAFKLTNVPAGANIPLILQIGKWRRRVTLPNVNPCTENVITDPALSRLPKNQAEGDIPQMAVTTGGCDGLACLFRKIGLDASEFTDSAQPGRMHIYTGAGTSTGVDGGSAQLPQNALWDSLQSLMQYDVVLLSCECSENNQTKSTEQRDHMRDYLNGGGRVFASHFHYTWFKNGPPEFQSLASWQCVSASSPFSINNGFPKGLAFQHWLNEVGSVVGNQISLTSVTCSLGNINTARATAWIYKNPPTAVKYFTFNTPTFAEPEDQCGRGAFADVHVTGSSISGNVPSGCNNNPLTDQEKALIFLYFDLAACITPDEEEPCKPNGEACSNSTDCCEGICIAGFCQPPQ